MTEENDKDPELKAWRGEWQSLGGKDDFATQLVKRATRDGRRLRLSAAGEILGATFSTTFCLWLVIRSHGSAEVVAMTAIILLFNGAWLTQFFSLRAGLFGSAGEDVEAFVTLTRKRLAAQRKWTTVARRFIPAIGALLVPWAVWVFVAHAEHYIAEPWRAVVGFGGAFGIFAAVYVWVGYKAKKLLAEQVAFERQLA